MSRRKKKSVRVEILQGVEGKALVIEGLRVAGPKAWGGGEVVLGFTVEVEEIRLALALRGHERRAA
jgi:hypothetical protein